MSDERVPTDDLDPEMDRLLVSLVMGEGSAGERLFRMRAAEVLLRSADLGTTGLDGDEILLLVEDVMGMLPPSRALALLEETRFVHKVDGLYRLREVVSVAEFGTEPPRRIQNALSRRSWTRDELVRVFVPQPAPVPWTVRTARDAMYGGYRWLLGTLDCDASGVPVYPVLPAFWNCDGKVDTPVGVLPAVTSVGDSLAALADAVVSDAALGHVPGDHAPALGNAFDQLLTYSVEGAEADEWDAELRAWNAGGYWPFDDQPEAAHPTVDATWDALIALTSLEYVLSRPELPSLAALRPRVAREIEASVRFLLRMQLDGGGWGIYRYLGDTASVPPYEFTTGQTILALGLALGSNLLADPEQAPLRAEVEAALDRAWTFLLGVAVEFEEGIAWTPYFRRDVERVSAVDVLCSSCWIAAGLLMLREVRPALRAELEPALAHLVGLADRHWEPDYGRLADASFRVPLAGGLSDTFVKWSNRYDVTVLIALLGVFNAGCAGEPPQIGPFTGGLWKRMERTVGDLVDEQHHDHGHWGEPVSGMPLAAATAMALLALRGYLASSISLASARDVVPPQA